jgi:hypothetical protein
LDTEDLVNGRVDASLIYAILIAANPIHVCLCHVLLPVALCGAFPPRTYIIPNVELECKV